MIQVVGIGPGRREGRTIAADDALRRAEVIVGYTTYVELVRDEFAEKRFVTTGMRGEKERCVQALLLSREGRRVALICSGDAQVYGMASLLLGMAEEGDEIEVVPGVTAALSAAAVLGAAAIAFAATKKKKENYLKSLFQGTYIRDIKERYNIRNDDDLNELIDIIASNIGCLTNPTNLENTFKSVKGHSISDTTIQSYLGMLQDAFMVEKAIRYDIKGKHYINTPSKYYFEDVGLRNARLNYRQIDGGHLMENIIYNELRIRGYSVDVGQVEVRTTNAEGKKIRKLLEVDFICNSGNKRMYIQSALDMPTPEKIDQETNSLRHINDGFPKIVIVGGLTPSYVNTDGISIMNVIDFLKDTEMGLL